MQINEFFTKNWKEISDIARRVIGSRWREGVSEYFLLLEKKGLPKNEKWQVHAYYSMKNFNKPRGPLNWKPKVLEGGVDIPDEAEWEWIKWEMMMDLENEEAVDFLINNGASDKWLKIYELVWKRGLKLNLFEKIIFDYVFIEGLSIKKIAAITGNSESYIYKIRKELLDKIKAEL